MANISVRLMLLLSILVAMASLLASCIPVSMPGFAAEQAVVATTTPAKVAPQPLASATAVIAPTLAPTNTASPLPTARATDTPQPTSTVAPSRTSAPTATSTPTTAPTAITAPAPAAAADPNLIVITEEDIAKAIAEGAGAQRGVTIENLDVRFADGKMTITAGRIGYGLIKLQNLNLVGRLVARDGVLSLEVESISPRGLATNFIPTMANQALAQYGSQWYVEDVRILDGRVELRIR